MLPDSKNLEFGYCKFATHHCCFSCCFTFSPFDFPTLIAAASANKTNEGPEVKVAASLRHSPLGGKTYQNTSELHTWKHLRYFVGSHGMGAHFDNQAWFLQLSRSDIHAAILHRAQDLRFDLNKLLNFQTVKNKTNCVYQFFRCWSHGGCFCNQQTWQYLTSKRWNLRFCSGCLQLGHWVLAGHQHHAQMPTSLLKCWVHLSSKKQNQGRSNKQTTCPLLLWCVKCTSDKLDLPSCTMYQHLPSCGTTITCQWSCRCV